MDYGPSNVAKFGGTNKNDVEIFFNRLKKQIHLRRLQVKLLALDSSIAFFLLIILHEASSLVWYITSPDIVSDFSYCISSLTNTKRLFVLPIRWGIRDQSDAI